MVNEFDEIRAKRWDQYWAGNWCLLTSSRFAYGYTDELSDQFGIGYPMAVLISRAGYTTCYLDPADRQRFAERRIQQVARSEDDLVAFEALLTSKATALLARIDRSNPATMDAAEIRSYPEQFTEYSNLHITPRHVVDFLRPAEAERFLPILQRIRKAVEPVFERTEEFCHRLSESFGTKLGLEPHLVRAMTDGEFLAVLNGQPNPDQSILVDRHTFSGLISIPARQTVVTGKEAAQLEAIVEPVRSSSELRGNTAYPGSARGVARVFFDPSSHSRFDDGDILVTGMTRPDFLPFMRRAGAVVTDAGGILSHAAITARELKIPTIIATRLATKVLQDGDLVEVDATKGLVRRLPR